VKLYTYIGTDIYMELDRLNPELSRWTTIEGKDLNDEENFKTDFKNVAKNMDPGTYFVGDVSILSIHWSETERAELRTMISPADKEDAFQGEIWLNSLTKSDIPLRIIVSYDTIGTKEIHIDSEGNEYRLIHPAIGMTLVTDMNDPLLRFGRLVTYTEPFTCSCYDRIVYDENLIPTPVRLLDFGPDVKFCLTDQISYPGMELTSERKATRERTWQKTNHFQEDEPIYNAVLYCLQVLNPVMK